MILRTSSSHEEGVIRDWSINTTRFSGDADGNVRKLHGVRLDRVQDNGRPVMKPSAGSEFELECELVLLTGAQPAVASSVTRSAAARFEERTPNCGATRVVSSAVACVRLAVRMAGRPTRTIHADCQRGLGRSLVHWSALFRTNLDESLVFGCRIHFRLELAISFRVCGSTGTLS